VATQTFTFRNLVPREETPLVTPTITAVVSASLTTLLAIVTAVLTVGSSIVAVGGSVIAIGGSVITVGGATVDSVGVAAVDSIVATTTDGEVNSVIYRSTLGNWHDDRLMVCSGGDGRQPVYTSGETLGNIGSELAVSGGRIETLEESEDTWVGGLRRVKRCDLLDDDVVVSNNLSGIV